MKILLISDTHSNTRDAMHIIRNHGNLDIFFHMGDTYQDAVRISEDSGLPMKAVSGNMDGFRTGPEVEVFSLAGIRFFLTHGDRFKVNAGSDILIREAGHADADVVCFGHTHVPESRRENSIWILNPGSLKGSVKTYGILTIDKGVLDYKAYSL